jgi:Putative lumazine-binding
MNTTTTDIQAIKDAVQLYIDGIHQGDTGLLKKAFHTQAMMYGTSGENVTVTPIEGLYSYVEANTPPARSGELHRCTIVSVRVSGNTASVEMSEDQTYGHNYVNYFHLLKIGGEWKIVSKSYSAAPLHS